MSRAKSLDAFRGLAIMLMVVDHLAIATGADWLHLTVGRLAMPAFFILGGHLAGRVRSRHMLIGALGVVVGVLFPWTGLLNPLTQYAIGVVAIAAFRKADMPLWILPVFFLTVAANGWASAVGGYDTGALVGLMAIGAYLPRSSFDWAERLPRFLTVVGARPILWYVSHIVVLDLLMRWL